MPRWRLLTGLVLVALGAGILAVAGAVLRSDRAEPSASITATPVVDRSFVPAIADVFALVSNDDTIGYNTTGDMSLWWITADGHAVVDDAVPAWELRAHVCEADDQAQSARFDLLRTLVPRIDAVMAQHGFTRNVRNSSRTLADDRYYDFVRAYERRGLQAAFVASPDCWSRTGAGLMYYSFDFGYTTDLAANARVQVPFLRDLSLGSDVVIHVAKLREPWAVIDVNYRRTGYYLVAKRIAGRWMQIFGGQDVPSCELTRTWAVPAAISACYDPATG